MRDVMNLNRMACFVILLTLAASALAFQSPLELSAEPARAYSGQEVGIPLLARLAQDSDIMAMLMEVRFDAEIFEAKEPGAGRATDSMERNSRVIEGRKQRILLFSDQIQALSAGNFLDLGFKIKPDAPAGQYPIQIEVVELLTTDGKHTEPHVVVQSEIEVLQNNAPLSVNLEARTTKNTPIGPLHPDVEDPDSGDSHTFRVVSPAQSGQVTTSGNAVFFSPREGFTGEDAFELEARDRGSLTVRGWCKITVLDADHTPPAFDWQAPGKVFRDQPATFKVNLARAEQVRLFWDFGDGVQEVESTNDQELSRNHLYRSVGTYQPRIIVQGENGASSMKFGKIQVALESQPVEGLGVQWLGGQKARLTWTGGSLQGDALSHFLCRAEGISKRVAKETMQTEMVFEGLGQAGTYRFVVQPVYRDFGPGSETMVTAESLPHGNYRYHLAHLAKDPAWWTGVVLVNANRVENPVEFKAFDAPGNLVGIGALNRLAPMEKRVGVIETFFDEAILQKADRISVTSTWPLAGFELFGTKSLTNLAGIPLAETLAWQGTFPLSMADAETWAGLGIVNPSLSESVAIRFTGHLADGTPVAAPNPLVLKAKEKRSVLLQDLFGETWHSAIQQLAMQAPLPVQMFQLWGDRGGFNALNGSLLLDSSATKFLLVDWGEDHVLRLSNPNEVSADVQIEWVDDQGLVRKELETQLAGTQTLAFAAEDLGWEHPGYLRVQGSAPLHGSVRLDRQNENGDPMQDVVNGQSQPTTGLVFPHIASNEVWNTDLMLINASDSTKTGLWKAYDLNGGLVESVGQTIAAHARIHTTAEDLFAKPDQVKFVVFEGDGPHFIGQFMYYNRPGQGQVLASIPAFSMK
jgi:PKD repeat protein